MWPSGIVKMCCQKGYDGRNVSSASMSAARRARAIALNDLPAAELSSAARAPGSRAGATVWFEAASAGGGAIAPGNVRSDLPGRAPFGRRGFRRCGRAPRGRGRLCLDVGNVGQEGRDDQREAGERD